MITRWKWAGPFPGALAQFSTLHALMPSSWEPVVGRRLQLNGRVGDADVAPAARDWKFILRARDLRQQAATSNRQKRPIQDPLQSAAH